MRSNAIVRAACCMVVVAASLGAPSIANATDPPTAAQTTQFDIKPQALASALNALALQSHQQILFTPEVAKGKTTQGVKGALTADTALSQLLAGTGLSAAKSADGMILVSQADAKGASAASGPPGAPAGASKEQSQSNPSSKTAATQSPSSLEEVIVTAQKRLERLQDVPVPVSVISTDALVNSDQMLFRDYYSSVPGLSMTTTTQSSQILSIRGIVTNPGNPTVGITVDDMPFGSSTVGGGGLVVPDFDPGDLSRVEVLRGPQGTLYGASSLGGLVKFVTVDPSTHSVAGNLQAGISSVHNGNGVGDVFRGAINVPVSDTLAVRASGFGRLDPGYIDNPVLNVKGINTARADGGMLAALWQPAPDFSLKLTALLQQVKGDGSSDVDMQSGLGDLQQSYIPGVGAYARHVQVYMATLRAKLGNVDLVSISGYNVNEFSDSWDYTFLLASATQNQFQVSGTPISNYNRTGKFTQEIRLSSSVGQSIDWLLGGFYTHEDSQYVQYLLAENTASGAIVGTWCNCSFPQVYAESAAFADLTYHFTSRFDVQVGARASRIRQIFEPQVETGPYDPVFLGVPSPVTVPTGYASGNPFTYLLTPRYQVSPDLMLYARLASGYQAGGSNQGVPGVPPQYDPSKTLNYEIGAKGDLLNHRLSFDASVYYIKWQDIQLSFLDPQNFMAYTGNGSGAKSEGVELSVKATPLQGLTLAAWVTYDDAQLTQAFPASVVAAGEYGVAGDRLPFSSRFSGYVSVDEQFPLGGSWLGFVGGDMSYVGDRLGFFSGTAQRTPFPAYGKGDLHAGVRDNSWTVSAFVNNVADKRAAISGGPGYFPPFAVEYIQPRLVGLNVSKAF